MSTGYKQPHPVLVSFVGFALAIVVMFMSGGSAKAAYTNIPVVLPDDPTSQQFINLANGTNDPGTGSGALVPNSLFKLYAENGTGAHRVDFDIVNRAVGVDKSCYNYKIAWGVRPLDSFGVVNGAYIGGARFIRIQGCSLGPAATRGSYGFTVPAGYLKPQNNVPGHVGPSGTPLYEAFLELQVFHDPGQNNPGIPDPGDNEQTATLRLYMDGADRGPGDGRIGFFGGGWATTYPSFSSPNNRLSTTFRPPCNIAANTPIRIEWLDDDYSTPVRQPNDPHARVYEYNPSTNPPTLTGGGPRPGGPGIQSSLVYGSGGTGHADFVMQPGKSYELLFADVRGANGIRIRYPYDSGDFSLPCPVPASPAINASCSLISVSVPAGSHWIRLWVNDGTSQGYPPDTPDFEGAVSGTFAYDLFAQQKLVGGGNILQWSVEVYNGATAATGQLSYTGVQQIHNCFKAACSFQDFTDVPGAPAGSGAVIARNGTLFVGVIITNMGVNDLPAGVPPNNPLSISIQGDGRFYSGVGSPPTQPLGRGLAPTESGVVVMPLALDGTISGGFVQAWPIYQDYMPLGPTCSTPLNTFKEFDHTLAASFAVTPDVENPQRIDMDSSVTQTAPPGNNPTVPGTATRRLIVNRIAGGQDVIFAPPGDSGNPRFGDKSYADYPAYTDLTPGNRDFAAGDQICAEITLDTGHGWIGPSDVMYSVTPRQNPLSCDRVEDRPFVRNYMGDVVAGGNFEGSSAVGSGVIKAYTRGLNGEAGSGVEFGAEALSTITGFSSAFLRTTGSSPFSPLGLSFANNALTSPCGASVTGCFRSSRQVRNYYDADRKIETGTAPVASNSENLAVLGNAANDGKQTWVAPTGKLTLTNPGPFQGHHELFVEGDVFIRDNIIYTDGPWANIKDIPNLRLVVKGDIYISRNVTQLDGTYVAQPIDATNGGKIYTCANESNGDLYSQTELYDFCRQRSDGAPNKLQVNGSFIAQDIKFLRTIYTLSSVPQPTPPDYMRESFDNDHAAESFRLSPDFFLGSPASQPTGGQNNGRYQDIKTLPPIL